MIAFLAAEFPLRSETFVFREVRELRRRGWHVVASSLRESPDLRRDEFVDLAQDLIVLYGRNLRRHVSCAAAEMLSRPVRSSLTLLLSLRDALVPGEPLALHGRIKLVLQALAALALARRLREAGVRHLHCHFAHSPASVGMYAARQLGLRFSFTGHANDLFERRALLGRKIARAAFVACISHWHRSFYERVRSDASGKLKLIRCGVDVDEWQPMDRTETAEEPLRILTVCRLVEKKGVDVLIRALAELISRGGRPWELVIAGAGPLEADLRTLSIQLGSAHAIQWLGEVSSNEVRSLMATATIFALPCRVDSRGDHDGIPVALMEAMSCELPVVAGDLPAIRELIEDGKSGRLHSGDARALADQLADLGEHPEERRRLGEAGRRRVQSEFSLRLNVDRLEAALGPLAGVSNAAGS